MKTPASFLASRRGRLRHQLALIGALVVSVPTLHATLAEGRTAWAAGDARLAAEKFGAVLDAQPASAEAAVGLAFARIALIACDPEVQAEAYRWGLVVEADPTNLATLDASVRWETLPASAWTREMAGAASGGDAARSGRSRHLWGSFLSAEFTGPGTLSFSWMLADPAPAREVGLSFSGRAHATVAVDARTSPVRTLEDGGAETVTDLYLGAGPHRVYWGFFDPTDSALTEAALYLDQVAFTPDAGGVAQPPAPTDGSIGDAVDSGATFANTGETDRPVFDQPTAAETQAFLRDTLLPRLAEVEALLAVYDATGPEFVTLDWSLAEWLPAPYAGGIYRFDRGDALSLRATIQALRGGLLSLGDQWDWSPLPLVANLLGQRGEGATLEAIWADYPALFTPRAGANAPAAALILDAALAHLRAASPLVAARPSAFAAGYFVPAVESFDLHASALRFPADLLPGGPGWADIDAYVPPETSVADALHTDPVSGVTLDFAPVFSATTSLRALAPVWRGNGVALGGRPGGLTTLPDPTFAGIVTGGDDDATLTEMLAEDGTGWWTYERWRTYRGGTGTLEEYLFPSRPVIAAERSRINLGPHYVFAEADGEWRAGASDHFLTAETSTDLATWTAATGGETGYFDERESYWNFYYERNGPPPARFFFRLKSRPVAWPADLTGWVVEFVRRNDSDRVRLTFTGPNTVLWTNLGAGGAEGPYATRILHDERELRLTVESPLPYRLEFGVDAAGVRGSLSVVPWDDPLMVANDTALHLFPLIGYDGAEQPERRSGSFLFDPVAKTLIETSPPVE